ncbi:DUF397 domain-containing protein [Sphaerisporangium melleum]|uniref:DUF397 domain-containing protein n=1 Tax=Sphaerisporangium melleum TaxID=321316 RepID=A0A917VFL9_9ACTN|nr:hypothetical protein GCM10007964_17740 [Sphaerisporangium melleum]
MTARAHDLAKELTNATWVKSSRSGTTGGNRVEVALHIRSIVAVRDSKSLHTSAVLIPRAAWSSFLTSMKNRTL